ncbi:hypothetical protein [Nocardia ignorata]|uniref:NAD(P)-binding protein n=1 Tax=Nocardia ignorata TaxID=145285 RepID=A0A4R6P2M3_NOCIG|nr:hypothetical protein [Nocardia ignorata]TDP31456.1 hypothetical protein DFR75_10861 [Nocardia ignorata]
MSIVITVTSGHLGRAAVEAVLDRSTDPAEVIAGARDLAKIIDHAARGVHTAVIDYDDPTTITPVNMFVLVSGTDLANRDRQHTEEIAAVAKAGAARIIYTSGLKADDTALSTAAMHLPTEDACVPAGCRSRSCATAGTARTTAATSPPFARPVCRCRAPATVWSPRRRAGI